MDEWDELDLVRDALHALRMNDSAWESNWYHFIGLPADRQYRWWQLAKRQADKGLPSMQQLVLEVIKLRMKS